jgi:hypothetical protein
MICDSDSDSNVHSSLGTMGALGGRLFPATRPLHHRINDFSDYEEYLNILETGLLRKKKTIFNIIKE